MAGWGLDGRALNLRDSATLDPVNRSAAQSEALFSDTPEITRGAQTAQSCRSPVLRCFEHTSTPFFRGIEGQPLL